MKPLKEKITEGFFNNINGKGPEEIIRKYFNIGHDAPWYPRLSVDGDFQHHHYSMSFPQDGSTVMRIHNEKHKTARKDIKIDVLKEWENCFSELFVDTDDKDARFYNEIIFVIWPSKYTWINTELWIYKNAGFGKPKTYYKYRVADNGNIYFIKSEKK